MTDLADAMRAAMRTFPTGVTIVTTMLEGVPHGFTASAFTSVSLDPPSLLLCVNRHAKSHELIAKTGRFCVNILAQEQRALAVHFSRTGDAEQFAPVEWTASPGGMPLLTQTVAWFECVLAEEHSVATHTIFVGNVTHCAVVAGRPLGYFGGEFHDFGINVPVGNSA